MCHGYIVFSKIMLIKIKMVKRVPINPVCDATVTLLSRCCHRRAAAADVATNCFGAASLTAPSSSSLRAYRLQGHPYVTTKPQGDLERKALLFISFLRMDEGPSVMGLDAKYSYMTR